LSTTGNHQYEGFTLWFTGLSGAGKTTLAKLVDAELRRRGLKVEMLDGDVVRTNLSKGLGFSKEDRDTNIRRIGFVCHLLSRNGVVAIASAISPYRAVRDEVRSQIGRFVEIFVKCPVDVCIERDSKGLYQKAIRGEIPHFTGISDPYEEPLHPEVMVETHRETPQVSAARILTTLEMMGYIPRRADESTVYSAEDEEVVQERLKALGYL
jgi:adenylylsulfate kinase